MRIRIKFSVVSLSTTVLLFVALSVQAADLALTYNVTMPQPSKHVFHVTMQINQPPAAAFEVRMPVWMQAVYELSRYSEQVSQVKVRTLQNEALPLAVINDHTWRVTMKQIAPVVIEYDLNVSDKYKLFGKSYLEKQIAVIHGGSFFLYVPELRRITTAVTVDLPKEWQAASALAGSQSITGPAQATFTAQDYDELTDSPILLGEFKRTDFTVAGIPFSVITDDRLNSKHKFLLESAQKIAAHTIEFFGGAPFDRYLFLYLQTDDPSGAGHQTPMVGVEHLKSTLITVDPLMNNLPGDFVDYLYRAVSTHELFHAWNVKAIRPTQLHYPDFDQPVAVRTLWLLEGFTEYYAQKFTMQIFDEGRPQRFYQRLNQSLPESVTTASLEQISATAATAKLDEFAQLYSRGSVAGFLLDLRLRSVTRNERGLDDLMRLLWQRYGATRTPYQEDVLPALINEVAMTDVSSFHRHHLAGSYPFPLEKYLQYGGWGVKGSSAKSTILGLAINRQTAEISDIVTGSNAELAGLKVQDKVLAINGKPVNPGEDWNNFANKKGNDKDYLFTIERDGQRQDVRVRLEAKIPLQPVITELSNSTSEQLAIRRAVLSATKATARVETGK